MNLIDIYLTIVLAPLIGSIIAGLLGKRIGIRASHSITILGVFISALLSIYVLIGFINNTIPRFNESIYTWATVGNLQLSVGFLVDRLTAVMMAVVTSVSLMVHIYTIGYRKGDPGYQRFFSYISLFTFAMLMLLMSNNFVQLFFGWEGVGLVSYLLIGFWFKKSTAIYANLKAFLVNRAGDFGLLLGIGLVFAYFGAGLDYDAVFKAAPALQDTMITLFPGWKCHLLTATCIFLFIGAMAKSAQFPLHVWLPDSMEGPTPISALIHAATMVTAGIFMVARMSPLYELSNTALNFIIVIGAITALFMGLVGMVQNDIKRVVAYSTLSQLGYMMAAMGASAYAVGIFHVMTHAFFKALLFLAAGSVIIGMHHDQDMRNMGGLRKYMPITWVTLLLGSLSLIGTPFFAGFYSKESILDAVYLSNQPSSLIAYWALTISVFVTAFYSFRLYFMVFHGDEKWKKKNFHPSGPAAEDTHLGLSKHQEPHESPWTMTMPLILLAIPSVCIGYFAIQPFIQGGFFNSAIMTDPALHPAISEMAGEFKGAATMGRHGFFSLPFWLAVLGVVMAFVMYSLIPKLPARIKSIFQPIYTLLDHKYYMDELYSLIFAKGSQKLGRFLWQVGDVLLIDNGIVNGTVRAVAACSAALRKLQTGYIYSYAMAMVLGLLVLMVLWFYPVIIQTFL